MPFLGSWRQFRGGARKGGGEGREWVLPNVSYMSIFFFSFDSASIDFRCFDFHLIVTFLRFWFSFRVYMTFSFTKITHEGLQQQYYLDSLLIS